MSKQQKYGLFAAIGIVVLILLAAGSAKLAGVPVMHKSFAVLGLPIWFGYFIAVCEVAGAIGLFIRPVSALAAACISAIMLGALYYHTVHTPLAEGIPALVVLLLCAYIFSQRRVGGSSPK
jgi:putative oxidoreductase